MTDCKKVRVYDYSDYKEGHSSNGGCYGYWVDYTRIGLSDLFEISYGTTADFDFCPCCGSFGDHSHYDCEADLVEYSCGDFKTITAAELNDKLRQIEESTEKWYEILDPKGE